MPEPEVSRSFTTRKLLDKSRDPWEYVDQELPTKTKQIFARRKQGTMLDSASGDTIMGSVAFSGLHHDFSPGSYSLRVTRRTLSIAPSATQAFKYGWRLRHSSLGTIDSITLQGSALGIINEQVKDPLSPIYALPPGTVWQYYRPYKGTCRVSASMEGVF